MKKDKWMPVLRDLHYQVSPLGTIARVFTSKGEPCFKPIYGYADNGYRRMVLHSNGERQRAFQQEIVATAFIGPRPYGCDIHHKDGNPLNNAVSNLEYINARKHRQMHKRGEFRKKKCA